MLKKMDNRLGNIYKVFTKYESGKVNVYVLCLDYNHNLIYPN